jgi:hypothetical protein
MQEQWEGTRRVWHDAVADRFEHEVWKDFEEHIPEALQAMLDLDEALQDALRLSPDGQ